ncbi:MAG: YegP family protein [Microbacterium sp.]
MAGKFELFTDKGGQWRFNLLASNGQVIASSEGYSSKATAQAGIESVKTNAAEAPVVER